MRACVWFLSLLCVAGLCGCAAGSPACTVTTTLAVSPVSGTADHAGAPPADQQKFTATLDLGEPSGCTLPLPTVVPIVYPAWSSSDPVDVTVSSAADATNGLATCVNATLAPVTLTATEGTGASAQTASVTLTCK